MPYPTYQALLVGGQSQILPPTIGTISVAGSGVDTVTYPAATAGTFAVGGYSLYVGTSPGAESGTAYATNSGAGSGTFTHAIPSAGTSNYYTVKAFDVAGVPNRSAASNEVSTSTASVATPPGAPTASLVATAGVDTIIYTAASRGTNPVVGYALYFGTSTGGESPTPVAVSSGPGGASFTHPSAAAGAANYYFVRAFDNQSSPNYSAASNEVSQAVTAPTAGTLSATTDGVVDTITFGSATAGTFAIAGYRLYVGSTSGAESGTPYATRFQTPGGTFTHPAPAPGTSLYYFVKVFDNATTPNVSMASSEAHTTTAPAAAPPTIGTISLSTAGGLDTISYPAPTAGDDTVAGVSLYRGYAAGGELATPVATNVGVGGGTFVRAAATPGTANYYVVRAFDVALPANRSAASNEVFAAVPAVTGSVGRPVGGLLSGMTYWLYVPAAGAYELYVDDELLTAIATGLPPGGTVALFPAAGIFTVVLVVARSGMTVAYIGPYTA